MVKIINEGEAPEEVEDEEELEGEEEEESDKLANKLIEIFNEKEADKRKKLRKEVGVDDLGRP